LDLRYTASASRRGLQGAMPNSKYNWPEFWVLWVAGMLGTIAVLPYVSTLLAEKLKEIPLPLPVILLLQLAQTAVLLALAVALGLYLAGRTGLSAPLVEAWLAKENVAERFKGILLPSVAWGTLVATLILIFEIAFFQPYLPAALRQAAPAAWQGLLASFYGGIVEEIFLRLFLLNLIAWLLIKMSKAPAGLLPPLTFWIANAIAALLFGLGHLPATKLLTPLTPILVGRALLLNGIAGVIFGYLFWKRGLESAILAHFSADVLLHVAIVPNLS